MKPLQNLTDAEKKEILQDGFNTIFWEVIKKVLLSWRAAKAHKIAAGRSLIEGNIRIEQGYYLALTDIINLEEISKSKKKKEEVKKV